MNELAPEPAVDLGRYLRLARRRWWLLLAGALIGLGAGYLVARATGQSYQATAEVYLGQTFAPGEALPLTGTPADLGLAASFVSSEPAIQAAAAQVGLGAAQLRGHVTAKAAVAASRATPGGPAPLLEITVSGSPPGKVTAAARALAQLVVGRLFPFPSQRLRALRTELAYDERALRVSQARLASALAATQQLVNDKQLSATDRLAALTNFNAAVGVAAGESAFLQRRQFAVRQQLSLAEQIEASRTVQLPKAALQTRPGRSGAAAVGASIGLILALLAALLWRPPASEREPTT